MNQTLLGVFEEFTKLKVETDAYVKHEIEAVRE
jgi:hypothetical protein